MFKKISNLINSRPKTVLSVMVALMLIAGAVGGGVSKQLTSGGFEAKDSESYQAVQRIDQQFGRTASNVLVKIDFKSGTVNDPANVALAADLEGKLQNAAHMTSVISYWSTGHPESLRSTNSTEGLIVGTLEGSEDQVAERIGNITDSFTVDNQSLHAAVGGRAEINRQFTKQIEDDLKIAEAIAFPITFIILVLVFRSLIAASLPILFGGFAILGSLFVLFVMTKFTDVSIYALNLTTMLGLGLAIDYSLFMVSRFREHLAKGESVNTAIEHTVQKAGKTILVSALTVAASLSALLVFPQTFLRSFAFAGVSVALVSALGSILLLPAALKLLGKNINKWPVGPVKNHESGSKLWRNIGKYVMKRPVGISLVVIGLLLFIGSSFLSTNLGQGDERSLPKNNPVRVVQDSIRADFSSRETAALEVVSTSNTNVNNASINQYSINLSNLKGVDHVESATGVYAAGSHLSDAVQASQFSNDKGTWLKVVPSVEPFSSDGEQLTKDVRNLNAPFQVQVGGPSASLVDLKQSIFSNLPAALAVIAIVTFVLLFMMFGSVVIPIKALVISSLSLSAVLGLVTWIFQFGNLSDILNFTPTGSIDATMPILMFCIAFGLSMDYEVFLLSRVKEQYDKTKDNQEAVVHGLEKTGGIISAAAISISIVFFAFATSGVTTIKLFGTGLFIAVLLDAFVIRGTLVPAFMRLAGRANWWAPKFMRKIYERFGFSE